MTDNATEKLQEIRSLLDERGVEYTVEDALPGWLLTVEHPTETWTYKICVHTTGLIDIWGSHITPEQAISATLGWIDEPDAIRNELADGGLIADALAPVCVDEKERRAFERGRVHERFAQQIFKEATS